MTVQDQRSQKQEDRLVSTGSIFNPPAYWRWAVAALFIGLVLVVLFFASIWLFARPLALLVLGIAIAAALEPIASRLARRLPYILAVLVVYLGILLILAAIIAVIVPTVVQQAGEVVLQVPALIDVVEGYYERYLGDAGLVENVLSQLSQLAGRIVAVPISMVSGLIELLLVLFISFYALLSAPNLRSFIRSLFPPGKREAVLSVLGEMAGAMGGYVRGVVIIGFLVGLITYIGLLIIGVRFPLVLGLLAGVLELIPYIGPILALIPMVLVALTASPTQALIVFIFFVFLQQLESNVFVPNIMKTQTEASPLLVMIAVIAGASLGGLLGAVVAIPIASALQVFGKRVVAPAIRRQTGAQPYLSGEEEPVEDEA